MVEVTTLLIWFCFVIYILCWTTLFNLVLFRHLHFMFGFFLEHSFGANGNLLTLFQYEKWVHKTAVQPASFDSGF